MDPNEIKKEIERLTKENQELEKLVEKHEKKNQQLRKILEREKTISQINDNHLGELIKQLPLNKN